MTNKEFGNFPCNPRNGSRKIGGEWYEEFGLTKREYFAAVALQGLLADPSARIDEAAEYAVKAADELINLLNK